MKKVLIGFIVAVGIFIMWNMIVEYQPERQDIKEVNIKSVEILNSIPTAEGLKLTSEYVGTVGYTPRVNFKYEGTHNYLYYENYYAKQLEIRNWKIHKSYTIESSAYSYKEFIKEDFRFRIECQTKDGIVNVSLVIMGKPM
jgi:hypothetical protein